MTAAEPCLSLTGLALLPFVYAAEVWACSATAAPQSAPPWHRHLPDRNPAQVRQAGKYPSERMRLRPPGRGNGRADDNVTDLGLEADQPVAREPDFRDERQALTVADDRPGIDTSVNLTAGSQR